MPPPDRSRHIDWDETTRPVVGDPETQSCSDTVGNGQGRHLVLIHDMFRQQLAGLVDVRDRVREGTADPGELRGQISAMTPRGLMNARTLRSGYEQLGAFCAQYCRAVNVHHTIEDRHLFPDLVAADARLRPVVDRLGEEHVQIHQVLVALDDAAVQLAVTGDGFDEVDRLVDVLASGLLSHLRYEEEQLVGPLGRHRILI